MARWASVASTVAATIGLVALMAGFCEAKRRRLAEIIDLIVKIRDVIAMGGSALSAQERLSIKTARFDLPKVRELASASIFSDDASSELSIAALAEANAALDHVTLISGCGRFRR